MNILELLKADGIQTVHASRGEWHSPCPECGGRDRFSCWPDKRNSTGRFMGGRFCCRQCGFSGDAVAYLMKRRGLSFLDACKALEIEPGPIPERDHLQQRRTWEPSPLGAAPSAIWQRKAGAFVLSCQKRLQRTSKAMDWLRAERGLNPETIRWTKLGWNPQDKYESRSSWGLPDEISSTTGKAKRVWLPKGLTITLFDDAGRVVRIRTRRNDPGEGSRYVVANGSSMQPLILWQDQPVVAIVESELDALLVHQEAGDLIGVVALGSAQQKPDSILHERLVKAELLLCCLDSDDAGAKAAWKFWTQYRTFRRWPPVSGKDPGEMFQDGVSVRAWIQAGF